jgi:hypothetical protein
MKHCHWTPAIAFAAALALACGCGRPTLPGRHFSGGKARTTVSQPSTSPLPEEPVLEWGNAEAKVRVVAFYPIDDEHQRLKEVLQEIADEYGDRVYVRYADPRTPEGAGMFQRAQLNATSVLINGENTVEIRTGGVTREVTFAQQMGRFWTAKDLNAAVAQEIAEVYGAGS